MEPKKNIWLAKDKLLTVPLTREFTMHGFIWPAMTIRNLFCSSAKKLLILVNLRKLIHLLSYLQKIITSFNDVKINQI